MKLYCSNCKKEVDIIVTFNGPHLQAVCMECFMYIKFLNKAEKRIIEAGEDNNAKVT